MGRERGDRSGGKEEERSRDRDQRNRNIPQLNDEERKVIKSPKKNTKESAEERQGAYIQKERKGNHSLFKHNIPIDLSRLARLPAVLPMTILLFFTLASAKLNRSSSTPVSSPRPPSSDLLPAPKIPPKHTEHHRHRQPTFP
ncbi:hypothetical protein CVT25_000238 [Psilocybe cyanescens]|uniref:Uncharacterized protein n=1 Tax=Psilocybe cyanescens TaxID=93625 RepID=A0A409W1S5_PSICY|nr:hypothetical protein CVT25_000238 [Psilocybe cyanescens]